MGFYNGRVSFLRFAVEGPPPGAFTGEHLERLEVFQAGRTRLASADGIEVGWTAGEHILDTEFEPAKNIINETLHCELRIDTDKVPGDLLKAYTTIELKALAAENPTGRPTARQKREAKELAREKIEAEAKDGRYKKRKCIPVLWDALSNEILFGSTSVTQIDRLMSLFQQSFGVGLDPMTAGKRAFRLAELHQRTRLVDDSSPSAFVPGNAADDVSWIADESSRDFLGNEFLLWLWYTLDRESDEIKLLDGSFASCMIARTLTLECPRGQTGHETISHEGPTRLPEALRAIQSGKLPRKCGLTVVRQSEQYEFALHAETLAVAGAKFPPVPDDVGDARARLDERAKQIRHFVETLDLLYDAFGQQRLGKAWAETLPKMQSWLAGREKRSG